MILAEVKVLLNPVKLLSNWQLLFDIVLPYTLVLLVWVAEAFFAGAHMWYVEKVKTGSDFPFTYHEWWRGMEHGVYW